MPIVATVAKDGYTAGKITIEEHFGTHLDAPAHFAAKGWTVDQIPVERLNRPGVRIDVSAKAAKDPDYRLTVADIKAFEAQQGAIPEGAIVLNADYVVVGRTLGPTLLGLYLIAFNIASGS